MTRRSTPGAAIFDGARLHAGAALVVEDGRVAGIVPRTRRRRASVVRLDGGVLAPGFIDLQVNGGGGVMLNDAPDLDGIRDDLRGARAGWGRPALLPTLITDTPEVTRARRSRPASRRRRRGCRASSACTSRGRTSTRGARARTIPR